MTHDYRVPVEPEVREKLNELAQFLKESMPEGWGFGLLMFTFGEKGKMVWISSGERESMLAAMQEFLKAQGS